MPCWKRERDASLRNSVVSSPLVYVAHASNDQVSVNSPLTPTDSRLHSHFHCRRYAVPSSVSRRANANPTRPGPQRYKLVGRDLLRVGRKEWTVRIDREETKGRHFRKRLGDAAVGPRCHAVDRKRVRQFEYRRWLRRTAAPAATGCNLPAKSYRDLPASRNGLQITIRFEQHTYRPVTQIDVRETGSHPRELPRYCRLGRSSRPDCRSTRLP